MNNFVEGEEVSLENQEEHQKMLKENIEKNLKFFYFLVDKHCPSAREDERDELVQELCLYILRFGRNYDKSRNFLTYFGGWATTIRIKSNLMKLRVRGFRIPDYVRDKSKIPKAVRIFHGGRERPNMYGHCIDIQQKGIAFTDRVDTDELFTKLEILLTPYQYRIAELHFVEGNKVREIAHLLGVKRQSVSNAIRAIIQCVQENFSMEDLV